MSSASPSNTGFDSGRLSFATSDPPRTSYVAIESARTSISTGEPGRPSWQIVGTPSPPDSPARLSVCAPTACASGCSSSATKRAPRLLISTPVSERQGGKFFSFSACSTPASNYVFRCLSSSDFDRAPRRILIVVDASKELNTEALQWTLAHIAQPGDCVTLLGLLPWLTLPIALKRWSKLKKIEGKIYTGIMEPDFQHMQDLYSAKEVDLEIKIQSGFPRRDIAADMAKRLEAKWIIFYRWMAKNANYFVKKLGKRKNIVFLKSKNEGNVSFASKPSVVNVRHTNGFESPSHSALAKDLQLEFNLHRKRMKLGLWLRMRVKETARYRKCSVDS